MKRLLLLILLVLPALPIRAEDWTTTDGKTYRDVKVLKVDPDLVTIMHKDGGGTVDLATLPPDLQRRFAYDPAKAKAAADARTKADQKNIEALQAEKDKQNAIELSSAQAVAKAQNAPKKSPATTTNTAAASGGPAWKPNGQVNPDTHVDNSHRERDDSDGRTHYSGISGGVGAQ